MTNSQQLPPTPCYLVDERRLLRNMQVISSVARRSGAKIIMAFKANALWRTFPIIRPYCPGFTASSLNELQLGAEEMGGEAHVYCPVYTPDTIDSFLDKASHITFNSLAQLRLYGPKAAERGVSVGLRVNPGLSLVETDAYNPSLPGTRFGVRAEVLDAAGELPDYLEGLHFHALCEATAEETASLVEAFEEKFGKYIDKLKWVNWGGGHLMTRQEYDKELLIETIKSFRERHPGVEVILEPGSAWTWQTGDLHVTVLDVVEDSGIKTAIIDASFACHMPDCLEMPYRPDIDIATRNGSYSYLLGGNSCLSGDYCGTWNFDEPLRPGMRLKLLDMNHYTTVKTTMFNGIQHPSMALLCEDGTIEQLRSFDYADYKSRMD